MTQLLIDRATLEQPVAYMAKNKNGGTESLIRARLLEQIGRNDDHDYTPLYAGVAPAPQAQQGEHNHESEEVR